MESLEKPSQRSSSCGLSALLFAGGLLRGDLPLSLVARCCSGLRTVLRCSCCEADTVCFEATSFLLFLVQGAFSPLQAGVFCWVPVVARLLNLKNQKRRKKKRKIGGLLAFLTTLELNMNMNSLIRLEVGS